MKPWLVNDYTSEGVTDEAKLAELAAPTGLRVYFAVASVMFSLIIVMYLMRMGWGIPSLASIGSRLRTLAVVGQHRHFGFNERHVSKGARSGQARR